MQAQNQKKFPKFFGGLRRETQLPRALYQHAVSRGGNVLDQLPRVLRGASGGAPSGVLREDGPVTVGDRAATGGSADGEHDPHACVRCVGEHPGWGSSRELALFSEKNRQVALLGASVKPEAYDGWGAGAFGAERPVRWRKVPDTTARTCLLSAGWTMTASAAARQRCQDVRCAAALAPRQTRRDARGHELAWCTRLSKARAAKKVLTDRSDDVRFCPERR